MKLELRNQLWEEFFYFNMDDIRNVISQIKKLQIMIREIIVVKYKICEDF